MTKLHTTLTQEMRNNASAFSDFRRECKTWLREHNLCFDKFTVREHDSYIGYISEQLICQYLQQLYPDALLTTWDESFDLCRVGDIVRKTRVSKEDEEYLCRYFYDRWDISFTVQEQTIYIDVKTALTDLQPRPEWTFLYPVVQARKDGKDIALLAYYITEREYKRPEYFKELVIAGYVAETTIRSCPVVKEGEYSSFHTLSRADNYETVLGTHYKPLTALLTELAGHVSDE